LLTNLAKHSDSITIQIGFCMPNAPQTIEAQTVGSENKPSYRSGAVARMVQMPVATLRIWERRYQAVAPAKSPSGHRLYSAADVERVALLRQLTACGHAIGSIAALTVAQLRDVARTHAAAATGQTERESPAAKRPVKIPLRRWVVVGRALAHRLQRPAVRQAWTEPPVLAAVFETLGDAQGVEAGQPVERLVWQTAGLRVDDVPDLLAAQAAWGAKSVAVVYGFAGAAARGAFLAAGVQLLRETQDDTALAVALAQGIAQPQTPSALEAAPPPTAMVDASLWLATGEIAPRRFDDATLTDLAGLSSTVACECPQHVAELLMQLSNFEAYSADCENLSPADAALHAYLHRVAGTARALFESALERVAVHENLLLR
jgi:MerR family transcriptional regulator, light-induced transcriptional regulator